MKKNLLLALLLMSSLLMLAEPFYVRVNGKDDYLATKEGTKDFQGRDQYLATCIPLKSGDIITCFDKGNNAEWAIAKIDEGETWGAKGFTASATGVTCSVAGNYDIRIKLKMNDDVWYFEGPKSDCTPATPGSGTTTGGGETGSAGDIYMAGWINGADYGKGEDYATLGDYKFVDGKLNVNFASDSYVLFKSGDLKNWYMLDSTDVAQRTATSATFFSSSLDKKYCKDWKLPKGAQTLTLTKNADGSITVSYAAGSTGGDNPGGDNPGGDTTSVKDPEEKGIVIKAHFNETTEWVETDGIYIWCWNKPAVNGHFVAMQKNSKGWYVASFEEALPDSMIFVNRGAWEEGLMAGFQTKTYAFPAASTCYLISWDGQGIEGDNGESWKPTATPTDCAQEWKETTIDDGYEMKDYASSVPSQCPDVMLQGFYWNSMGNNGFGNTKWETLLAQAAEIGSYFDLVWLAPSAKSEGGLGYHPRQYCNQSSDMGNKTTLKTLISALHASNTKVIADIVINHAGNKSGWCDFFAEDFGAFGKFNPDYSWITKDDEVWSQGQADCKTPGANAGYDDGQGDPKGYGAARDWDHTQANVRAMFKAYLKWMKNEMKYDGWRYDYCKGFHEAHIDEYNKAAQNYFSVMEWWDGNGATLKAAIDRAGGNTLTFDFATKYTAFDQGIAAQNYSKCRGAGLPGMGYAKYAVTFIDSHDTFQREESRDVCGSNNGGSINNKSVILQCNAYLLSMPGVPCVFYPHWVKYKEDIKKMIYARKMAGVHSESAVNDNASGSGYEATITGKTGEIKLYLGDKAAGANPSGYIEACKGEGYAVYYKTTKSTKPVLSVTPNSGSYKTEQTIQMSAMATGACDIYYTTNGTEPSKTSTKYTAAFTVSENTTIKAIAYCGAEASDVVTRKYEFVKEEEQPADPIPEEGITIRFHIMNECGWETDDYGVAYYVWRGEGKNEVPEKTKFQATKTGAWWTYTFPESFETPFNIIAHMMEDTDMNWPSGNAYQTVDIKNISETTCFIVSKGAQIAGDDGSSWKCPATKVDCGAEIKPEDPRGLTNTEAKDAAIKTIINGHLFIIRGEHVYNVQGLMIQ